MKKTCLLVIITFYLTTMKNHTDVAGPLYTRCCQLAKFKCQCHLRVQGSP